MVKVKITHGQLVKACLDYLQWVGKTQKIYAFKSASGQVQTQEGRFFTSGKAGCPDITCCMGGFIGVECKTGKDTQSALQKKAQAEIEAAGGKYYVIRSLEELRKIFPICQSLNYDLIK